MSSSSMMKRGAMAGISQKHYSSNTNNIRSISLPTRSHPSTARVEEELNKLKSWEPSSSSSKVVETICCGLHDLKELYKCVVEDLLNLPLTQQALSQHHNEKWVDELLDFPLRFLEILGETRDSIMLLKGNVGEVQSALRRRKMVGDFGIENHLNSYWTLRRNMRKECTKSLLLLKHYVDHHSFGSYSPPLDLNQHLSAVVRVLRESSLITSSIFQSLLVFLSSPIFKFKARKWDFVSRLLKKGVLVCNNIQQDNVNEIEKVDLALCRMVMDNNNNQSKDFETQKIIQSAQREIEALILVIEGLENGLEGLFKHLINTRVSFLNIISP
ncbi:uncharacterized protein DS421_5g136510 [Arachis hypogaea]|nr:uncharacterized protein DS421_5g136510 [Arachis hypogaea]